MTIYTLHNACTTSHRYIPRTGAQSATIDTLRTVTHPPTRRDSEPS